MGVALAHDRRGVGICGRCGKVCYRTRAIAKAAKRVLHPTEHMRAYQCGSTWHFGHNDGWKIQPGDDLFWRPLPPLALAQIAAVARATLAA